MDFEPTQEQADILEATRHLLERHAGAARAIELSAKDGYDDALEQALEKSGFADVMRAEDGGPLEAALLVEGVARHAGVVAAGARLLVAPGLIEGAVQGPVALARSSDPGPARYAPHARTLLLDDGEVARVVPLEPGDVRPVASKFGYPFGSLALPADRGRSCGPGSGERLRSWWRVALAAEAAGSMRAALDVTLDYLKQRRQFGRALGSFQALQHRLAECHVLVEGTRWLALEAAWQGAPAPAAASAAAHAAAAGARVFAETHQLSGAIGFTLEHDLHVHSMRLVALGLELGGLGEHCRASASARWQPGS